MSVNRLFRWSGGAAVASGVFALLCAGTLIAASVVPAMPGIAAVALLMLTDVLKLFALMGLYGGRVRESGWLGLAGFILAVTGQLFGAAEFFPPSGWAMFALGLAMIAAAAGRGGALPQWGVGCLWVWLVGIVVSLAGGILDLTLVLAAGLAIQGCARIGLGIAMRSVVGAAEASDG